MSRRSRRVVNAFYPQGKSEIVKISPKNQSRRNNHVNFATLLDECNSKIAELESYNEVCHKTNEQLNHVHQEYKKLANAQIDALRLQLEKLKRNSVKYKPSRNIQGNKRGKWSRPITPFNIATGTFGLNNNMQHK
jgi:hypothetical protein